MAPAANGASSDPSRSLSPLQKLRASLLAGETSPRRLAEQAFANANQNAGRNIYLSLDKTWTLVEADRALEKFGADALPADDQPPLRAARFAEGLFRPASSAPPPVRVLR
jgi:hypothetical protein